jgi:hypothetical protein
MLLRKANFKNQKSFLLLSLVNDILQSFFNGECYYLGDTRPLPLDATEAGTELTSSQIDGLQSAP